MRKIQLLFLVLCFALVLDSCKRVYTVPPLVSPVVPRRSLDAQYTRLRIVVAEALDRTGVAGGVVDTGATGGALLRSGQILIAPPTRDLTAMATGSVDRGAPSGPISMVSFKDGFNALTQTIGATLQGLAATSERFEVVTDPSRVGCDLRLKTWVTGSTTGELTVDQVFESCDVDSAVSAVDGTIRFSAKEADVLLDRADVKRLLKKLIATLPEPAEMGKGTILEREGRYVTLSVGKEQNVQKGTKAFAVSYGDRKVDTKSGLTLGDEVFTGDLYVFAVYPKISRAWIVAEPADYLGDNSRVRVGDYVVFK